LAHGLEAIDWSAPWLAPYKEFAELEVKQAAESTQVCDLLNSFSQGQCTAPVDFVPQNHLPIGVAYEQYIFNTKKCPTRDGLHDFFNGLCWHQFPKTKTRLNQLQAEQIKLLGSVTSRGPVRDALTVFDENAAFLAAPPDIWEALIAKDWMRLFVALRPLWKDATLVLFGHALLEKLVNPRKAITAHVYVLQISEYTEFMTLKHLDALIAQDLSTEKLRSKPFAPLPVYGVPGWCLANTDPVFYEDRHVFR
jgi:hypothetical protein